MTKKLTFILAAATFLTQTLTATLVTYSDKATFLADTGATSATGALPNLGNVGLAATTIGDLTIQSASGSMFVGLTDWTTRLPGNEIAISDLEHVDVKINLASATYAFGFDFVEPEFDPNVNAPFVDSTFTVELKDGLTSVDSFTYNAANDTAAFVGVWSDVKFDFVSIRETTGGIENEFFGEMYSGATPPRVPDTGSTALLLGMGLMGLAAIRRQFGRG